MNNNDKLNFAINITIEDIDKIKTVRENKGKSLTIFPDNYTIIDIEATGYSPKYDDIIEVGAIKYRNNLKVDEFSSLINGEICDKEITELTGITNEMLSTAPPKNQVLKKLFDFLGNDILVGYNVNFDINFLYDGVKNELNEYLKNDYVDVMRIAKKYLKELDHHRLKDIVEYYNITVDNLHRSISDCEACKLCYDNLKNDILKTTSLETLFKKKSSSKSHSIAKYLSSENSDFDESHPLYNKVCAFTGALDKMTRKDAMQIVLNVGGQVEDNVTKKTNFLIIGNFDFCKSIKDGKSRKHKKALELAAKGQDIQIISEQDFYDII